MALQTEAVLTCPECSEDHNELKEPEAGPYFFFCTGCGIVMEPRDGDCCVFCSYSSEPCG